MASLSRFPAVPDCPYSIPEEESYQLSAPSSDTQGPKPEGDRAIPYGGLKAKKVGIIGERRFHHINDPNTHQSPFPQ
jgi:hypothetical protein